MSSKHPEEWGVVVVTGGAYGEGARLFGLFESKSECFTARTAFVEQFAALLREYGRVEKGTRTLRMKPDKGEASLATFSCLPLSEIRGLSLKTNADPK